MKTEIRETCGNYPGDLLQYEGELFGHPFYFRQKHGEWSLNIALPGRDPVRPTEGQHLVAHAEGKEELAPPDAIVMIGSMSRAAFERLNRKG